MFFLSSVLLWSTTVRADLPVHCLRHQIPGEWEFTLTQPKTKRGSCGHLRPDSEERQPSISYIHTLNTTKKTFILQDPDVAKEGAKAGTWTMVYDEGFEVKMGDFTFFAFSRFELIPDDSAESGHRNISHCGETEVGWYHNAARSQWGCYVGKKLSSTKALVEEKAAINRHHLSSHADKVKAASSLSPSVSTNVGTLLLDVDAHGYDEPLSEEWHRNVTRKLNLIQSSWKARSYAHLINKTARSMNKDAGIRRNIPRSSKTPARAKAFLEIVEEMPASLDWRNKDGKSYLDDVISQGDCGSCYSISTVRMLSARNRVRAGNPKLEPFSITFPLYCSEYNQGCGGGYGFLESKWSEDVGLVPESCAPYNQMGTCELSPGCQDRLGAKRYRAANHRYVGGFYGATDSNLVASELTTGGPLVMSFEPKEDFMYYENGIYHSVPNKIHQEWEQVDHAVLLVGYGEEDGKKYWLLQNSWGEDWGEKGYFRMLRGQDESGCESIVVAAEVVEEPKNVVLDDFLKLVSTAEDRIASASEDLEKHRRERKFAKLWT